MIIHTIAALLFAVLLWHDLACCRELNAVTTDRDNWRRSAARYQQQLEARWEQDA